MIDTTNKIKVQLNIIPELPGIYKFLDSNGRTIYVGKSKNLKKRVKSYFVDNPKWDKVNRIVPWIDDLEFVVTDTHLEARLLECKLIKSIKPIFNSQMKNDEKYVYLKIEEYNRYNSISIVNKRTENCFGPFRKEYSLYKIIESLKNLYPISKSNNGYEFDYHTIPIFMNEITYEQNKAILMEIFLGEKHMATFIENIEAKMKDASSIYKFETALMYRNIINNLNYLKSGINGYRDMFLKNIILRISIENGTILFFITRGQITNKKTYKRLSKRSYDLFINNSLHLNISVPSNNEKMNIDYRDILYSEILSLPNDMVDVID